MDQKFQDLEEERLDFMKSSLWTFANIASTVCVSDDAVSHAFVPIIAKLTILSPAKRFDSLLRDARLKRTYRPSSMTRVLAKRSRILQNTSTFVEAMSMMQHQSYPRRIVTLWHNFKGPSTQLFVVLHRSLRLMNRTTILNRTLLFVWEIWIQIRLLAKRRSRPPARLCSSLKLPQ